MTWNSPRSAKLLVVAKLLVPVDVAQLHGIGMSACHKKHIKVGAENKHGCDV